MIVLPTNRPSKLRFLVSALIGFLASSSRAPSTQSAIHKIRQAVNSSQGNADLLSVLPFLPFASPLLAKGAGRSIMISLYTFEIERGALEEQ